MYKRDAGEGWTTICADSMDEHLGVPAMLTDSVDHVITDPPYAEQAHAPGARVSRGKVEGEALDFEAMDNYDEAAHHFAIAKRWVLVFCQAEQVTIWRDSLLAAGLNYRRTGIWLKPDAPPQLSGDRPAQGYESICIAHRPGRSRWNGGGKHGVWPCVRDGRNAKRMHPTQKPRYLMEMLIRDFTDPGDLICDPYMGAGTTGVAAVRLGRRFIGFERDPDMYEAARQRMIEAREQLELFIKRTAPKGKQEDLWPKVTT